MAEGKHCSVCNEVLVAQEIVKANGHTEVIDEAVAPTCTETGLTEGKHCSVCKEVLTKQEVVKANGHTEAIKSAVEATCTKKGLTEGTYCSVCNKVLVAQTWIPKKPHTEVIDPAVEAISCTQKGLTEGKHCSACGAILVYQMTTTKSHVYDQENTADKYLKSETTCKNVRVYYYSCECGRIGYDTFTVGDHVYNQENTDAKYLKSEASYKSAALYYYSCECGKKGSNTFTFGDPLTLPIILPETPLEFKNWSNPAYFVHTKVNITSIECEIEDYSSIGKIGIQFRVTGTKTFDSYNGSHKVYIGLKLIDPNGIVVAEREIGTPSIAVGQSFSSVNNSSIFINLDNIVPGDYTLQLIEIAW